MLAGGFGGQSSAATAGACRIHMTSAMETDRRYGQVLDTAFTDGSVVVGSSYLQGKSAVVHLRRILPSCQVVARFGVVIRSQFTDWGIDTVAATPDGRILLAGNSGRSAVVGRLSANGGLDRTFGDDGWTRIRPYKHRQFGNYYGFSATSLAVGSDGRIAVAGVDGGAHCCIRSFVTELTPDGVPIKGFGHDGSRVVPDYAGSYAASVFPNSDRSIYVFGQYEQSGCGAPNIVRFLPDGLLDRRFDSAIARTIKRLTRRHFRFTPTLVPDPRGGFTLVGGLDRTCVLSRYQPSGGVSVRVGADGAIIGELTHFVSPRYAFDSPAALRLPGRIVVAGPGVTSALVQVLGPDGSRDPSVGDHGLLRVAFPPSLHPHHVSGDLLTAAGGAWLVTGFPHEIDLTPVGVR